MPSLSPLIVNVPPDIVIVPSASSFSQWKPSLFVMTLNVPSLTEIESFASKASSAEVTLYVPPVIFISSFDVIPLP